ncbi:DUF4214 domain-containing protein [Maritalea porphyrae]|uniref:DUF4214 domain-containing protein n=1 Tax=Maritalea porphyrae TaxID=880732 RepID=UPI0022AF53BE|nr:DUF4214 domain-containing protein [Maritalea porphyrae]MCZ4271049.1 DUF4214 domain-containing protein [Maritalea porphyrae]
MSVELLTKLYVGYYDRAPDPVGLEYWEGQLGSGMSASQIAQSFSVQEESKANYPYLADQDANDAQAFIAKIYQNLFNRAPDPEGLEYWTGQLEGGYPIGSFILAVINGARNTEDGNDKTMLEQKVSVGIAFKDAETGKDNPNVVADAKDVMSGVNHTDASVKMALGKIADGASGAATVFNGSDLGDIEDGTLLYDGNKYTNNQPGEQPESILVTNGADFEMSGILALGGAKSELTVRGDGSSANFKATFNDDDRSDFGRFSGDHSTVNVADGATLTFGKGVKFGLLRTEDDAGTAGGASTAELNILGGGKVFIGETAKFADNGQDDGGDKTATSKVDILIHGEGSLLDIDDQVRAGGSSGDVTFDIRNGGKLDVANDFRFARSTDYNPDIGGKGALEVRGATSSVEAGRIKFALDKGAVGSIFADDGATIQTERVDAGGMGGSASIKLTDGAKIIAERLDVANGSGSTATVDVLRGAKIELSDNLSIGQFNNGYADDEGISLSVPDGATKVDFTIADGGIVSVAGNINAAVRWELDEGIVAGNENAEVNLTVSGQGSLLESKMDWSSFGVSKNGVANVKVLDGAKAILGEGANFGQNSDKHDQFGGEGNLTVSGEGSTVQFIEDSNKSMNFGSGQNAVGTLTVSNGAQVDLQQIEAGREGGASTITVLDNGMLNLTELTAAKFSGSSATINISNGGMIELENRLDLANFAFGDIYDDGGSGFGIANAASTANLNITNGGVLKLGAHIDAATRWENKEGVDVGTESALVNINVSGAGSKIESASNTSYFGVSKDAVANVNVTDGGSIVFGEAAVFGDAAENFDLRGGEGNLTIDGPGSSVSIVNDGKAKLEFANGENSVGTLTMTNGASIVLDAMNSGSPSIILARQESSNATMKISGAGTSVTLKNDNPRNLPDQPDSENGRLEIGRAGKAVVEVTDGASFTNTENGLIWIAGEKGGSGSLTVSGEGTTFNYGGSMVVGSYQGDSEAIVNFTNGATINNLGSYQSAGGEILDGIYLDEHNGTILTIDGSAKVNSDLSMENGNFIVSAAIETVNLNGALNQNGGEIDLQIASTTSHDKLVTTGSSTLKGELNIAFENGFAGAAGDSFELFNATSFEVGGDFKLDVSGLGAGLDAQLQVSGTVASLVLFDSQVADFAII